MARPSLASSSSINDTFACRASRVPRLPVGWNRSTESLRAVLILPLTLAAGARHLRLCRVHPSLRHYLTVSVRHGVAHYERVSQIGGLIDLDRRRNSGLELRAWYPLFPNPVVAESLLDRLINNSHQCFMNGPSYRPNKSPVVSSPRGTRAESKIATGPGPGELPDHNPWGIT